MHGGVEGEVSGVEGSAVASVAAVVEEIEEAGHATEVFHGMVGRRFLGQIQAAVWSPHGHSLHCSPTALHRDHCIYPAMGAGSRASLETWDVGAFFWQRHLSVH